ncbi:MAG: hypothetical protein ACF8K1_08750 [Phycisphaerales bacterium JB047]
MQSMPARALTERLRPRCVTQVAPVYTTEDLWQAADGLRQKHESGDPFLPAKYVTAMHIIWKLNRLLKWGGNAKSYLWADDLPKGRGMPDELSEFVPETASDLLQAGCLSSKRSKTGVKYCLNPSMSNVLYQIMDQPIYPDCRLPNSIHKGVEQVSARLLDEGIRLRQADKKMNPTGMELQSRND